MSWCTWICIFSLICGIIWRFRVCKIQRHVRGGCVHVASVVFFSKKPLEHHFWAHLRLRGLLAHKPAGHPDRTCELCAAAHGLHRQYWFFTPRPYFLSFVGNRVPSGLLKHQYVAACAVLWRAAGLNSIGCVGVSFIVFCPSRLYVTAFLARLSPQELLEVSPGLLFLLRPPMVTSKRRPDVFSFFHLAAQFITLERFDFPRHHGNHSIVTPPQNSSSIRSEGRNPAGLFVLAGFLPW